MLAFASFPAAWQEPEVMGINIESDSEDLPDDMQGDYAALRLLLTHEPLSSEAGATPPHFNDEDSGTLL